MSLCTSVGVGVGTSSQLYTGSKEPYLKHLECICKSAESPELSKHISAVIMVHVLLFLISAAQAAQGLPGG